jgi:hypothetical protein
VLRPCYPCAARQSRQWYQNDPVVSVVNQRPNLGALVAQPVPLHSPRLEPCMSGELGSQIPSRGRAFRLNQKQFALAQSKKWSSALRIRTVAEHDTPTGRPFEAQTGA